MGLPADLEALRQALADVPAEAAASAAGQLDPAIGDATTYFGVRPERELARLSEELASLGASPVVADASAALGRMLERLRSAESLGVDQRSLLDRLMHRGSAGFGSEGLDALQRELDRLAAELQTCTGPLLRELVSLEGRERELAERRADLDAHLRAGLDVLASLADGERSRELRARIGDLAAARTVALQGQATLGLMIDSRRRLHQRVEFVLARALPLWQRQAELVRSEFRDRRDAARERLTAANAALVAALAEPGAAARPGPPPAPSR